MSLCSTASQKPSGADMCNARFRNNRGRALCSVIRLITAFNSQIAVKRDTENDWFGMIAEAIRILAESLQSSTETECAL